MDSLEAVESLRMFVVMFIPKIKLTLLARETVFLPFVPN